LKVRVNKHVPFFLAFILFMMTICTTTTLKAYAQVEYSYQDQQSATKLPEGTPYISGQHMVWLENDSQGIEQVFYQNLTTGEKKQVTNVTSPKSSPEVGVDSDGKVYLVWSDKRNFALNQVGWDLFGYQLETGHEWKLNSTTGMYVDFSMGGSDIVSYDNYSGNMRHFDLKLNKETLIGKGRSPAVAKGKVLFINSNDGGLSLTDLVTGATRSVLDLPYRYNVINLTFNGTVALYKQADLDWNTKYVMLNISDLSAKPVDLTIPTKRDTEYYQLYIGNNQAAWLQDNHGVTQLVGANLQNSETYTVAQGAEAISALAFSGDQLLVKSQNGCLSYKTIIRNEIKPINPSYGGGGTVPQGLEVKQTMDVSGGDLATKDGTVKIHIPAGAIGEITELSLKPNSDQSTVMSGSSQRMLPASKVWDVSVGSNLLQNVQLTFQFESPKWTQLQTLKMQVYQWDGIANVWIPVGGKLDEKNHSVSAEIRASGTYALFVNDISFQDSTRHWAQSYIETLAARGIVSGMDDAHYAPNAVLTRAQFTKMLLGALSIQPSKVTVPSFVDVPQTHWSNGWVEAAVSRHLVQGNGEQFNPDSELTREQMMVMLVRAMNDSEKALSLSEKDIANGLTYTDSQDVSSWAKAYAALSTRYGLIDGDNGRLLPKQSSTRAQAAAVIYRLLVQLGKI
jgi:hypothetical protein